MNEQEPDEQRVGFASSPDEAAPLEAPTGKHGVRGPTAFVLGLVIALAIASIVRTCLA